MFLPPHGEEKTANTMRDHEHSFIPPPSRPSQFNHATTHLDHADHGLYEGRRGRGGGGKEKRRETVGTGDRSGRHAIDDSHALQEMGKRGRVEYSNGRRNRKEMKTSCH